MAYKVLYGEVPEWCRDIENIDLDTLDLKTVGTFANYEDAFSFTTLVLIKKLRKLGYDVEYPDYIGDIWWKDERGHYRAVATVNENDMSITDTDEWWVIVS